jgi:hypothetical protein
MYDKKRIAAGLGTALVLWAVVGMIIMSSGVALGDYPVAGVGGFVLSGSNINAQQMLVYPGTAESRNGTTPAAIIEFQQVTIEDFTLAIKQDISDLPGVKGTVNIRLTSVNDANLQAEGVIVKASAIRSDFAQFQNLVVEDSYGTRPSEKLTLTGTQADLVGGVKIQAHYLAVRSFDFPAFEADVWWDTNNDGRYEFGGPN